MVVISCFVESPESVKAKKSLITMWFFFWLPQSFESRRSSLTLLEKTDIYAIF
jgi:hypothetical protein